MKRFFKWLGVGLLVFVLFILVLAAIPGSARFQIARWCVRSYSDLEWKCTESALKAKGEQLTFAELIPPTPADADNCFSDTLWLELFYSGLPKEEWQINQWQQPLTQSETDQLKMILSAKEVIPEKRSKALMELKKRLYEPSDPKLLLETAELTLDLAKPAAATLSKIAELLNRRGAALPIRYQDGPATSMPHLSPIIALGQVLGARSLAELALEKTPNAANDIFELLDLQKSLTNELVVLPFLVRQSLIVIALDSINRGISLHRWSDGTLSAFQQKLAQVHLQQNLLLCLRGERASVNTLLQNPKQEGWDNHQPLPLSSIRPLQISAFNRIMQNTLENLEIPGGKPWNIEVPVFPEIETLKKSNRLKQAANILPLLCLPALKGSVFKTVQSQSQVNQTIIACALERYRIAHCAYPTSLDALVPEYLTRLPSSPISGKPMNYSLKPDGTFLLWSPNWNMKSLGGKPGEYRGDGDIVWNQPLPNLSKESPTR